LELAGEALLALHQTITDRSKAAITQVIAVFAIKFIEHFDQCL
jgi:hypothetical protein